MPGPTQGYGSLKSGRAAVAAAVAAPVRPTDRPGFVREAAPATGGIGQRPSPRWRAGPAAEIPWSECGSRADARFAGSVGEHRRLRGRGRCGPA